MTNIELYINKKLCDIQSPEKLGIRLNRVLINPAELSTKDAQYSYSVTLPASPRNNAVFSYANVEEVPDKFNADYNAILLVDGVTVFDGKFRMSDITADEYKGNLVVPAKKTIKEIFGDKKMNEVGGEWVLNLENKEGQIINFPALINKMNETEGNPPCLFPYVLYGLMPKVQGDDGKYTLKNWFDSTVRLGIEDFPPSINSLQAIKEIFANTKDDDGNSLNISGDVFNDKRMQALYMSYKNPTDYAQPWNWGELGKMRLKGTWTNYLLPEEQEDGKPVYEHFFTSHTNRNDRRVYVADILKGRMTEIDEEQSFDNGTNISRSPAKDNRGDSYDQKIITIPYSGLYKISFAASLEIKGKNSLAVINKEAGVKFIPASFQFGSKWNNFFAEKGYEIKLLRDFGEGFDYESIALDSTYYRPNLPQDAEFDKDKETVYHFPVPGNKTVQFIDPCVNQSLIGGFRWGRQYDDVASRNDPRNPKSTQSVDVYNYILSIKNGWSWDVAFSQKEKIFSAINSPAYATWGRKSTVSQDKDSFDEIEIGDPEENELNWVEGTKKFKVEVNNAPDTESNIINDTNANGELYQIIWLNKGERITLVSVSDQGASSSGPGGGRHGWIMHSVNFDLQIEPFKTSWDWVKISNGGTGTKPMNWNDNDPKDAFVRDKINLFKFLPSDVKIDDWLDSFCKAFNLHLSQPETGKFELNFRQKQKPAYAVIELDNKMGMQQRANQPLGLPAVYELGFKIEKEEQGYDLSKDDGGGRFETGTLDGQTLTQSSSFSFNWFQPITQKVEEKNEETGETVIVDKNILLPVISNKEVWKDWKADFTADYAEMQKKLYTNYAQRFWVRSTDREMYSLGLLWKKYYDSLYKGKAQTEVKIPVLSNFYADDVSLMLNYKDEPYSILRNYFHLIATNDSNYTEVECYLSPDEYERIDAYTLVKYNGDLYYVGSIEGYDPAFRNKTKLKLIRKTV